ncbi:glycerophosphodiester phosphodiesterase [Halomonas sp. R1t8]|uniref:glycerophosphodiester phosphodiesterase family protein n=1 Tax=unclassified Halomonas TaxID=2609666 RepID=UPI001D18C98C|nr:MULTISPECIES: glycerophosphodiester phosphodiesterase family protein [Halomonas]MCP1303090.1 glycerophosphodiester phosphodiesterase [Halomonas sp. R1t8]MCP1330475.1 glycerophosphodiester phosphodiesterase [Halomonas sp. R1t4]
MLASTSSLALAADATPLAEQLDDLSRFQVIAHRGASGHAPESTLAAYELAHRWGVDYLELDAQLSADGEVVLFHDGSIERTSDGEGHIHDYTLAELKALDTGSWFQEAYPDRLDEDYRGTQILTLDELFDHFGHTTRYYIETKSPDLNPGLEEALVERLEAYDMIEQGQVLVQSFDQESLLKVRDLNQDVPLIQLLWYSPSEQDNATLTEWNNTTPGADTIRDEDFERIAEYAVGIGTNAIYQGQPVIDADFVHQAQKNGLSVHVYTINEQEDMKRVMALGVNGLFTDYPDRLLELVSD